MQRNTVLCEGTKSYELARSFGKAGKENQELGIMISSNDTKLVRKDHFQFAPHWIEVYFGFEVVGIGCLGVIDVDRAIQIDLLCHFVEEVGRLITFPVSMQRPLWVHTNRNARVLQKERETGGEIEPCVNLPV